MGKVKAITYWLVFFVLFCVNMSFWIYLFGTYKEATFNTFTEYLAVVSGTLVAVLCLIAIPVVFIFVGVAKTKKWWW